VGDRDSPGAVKEISFQHAKDVVTVAVDAMVADTAKECTGATAR